MKKKAIAVFLVLAFFVCFISDKALASENSSSVYEKAREEWQQARGNGRRSYNQSVNAERLDKAKKFAMAAIDLTASRLGKISLRLQKSNYIESTAKKSLAQNLTKLITTLEEVKLKVNSAQTGSEFRAALTEERKLIQDSINVFEEPRKNIVSKRLGKAIDSLLQVEDRLELKVQSLKNSGYNTEVIDIDLKKAKESLSEAKTEKDLGKFSEATGLSKTARLQLKKAVSGIRDLVQEGNGEIK